MQGERTSDQMGCVASAKRDKRLTEINVRTETNDDYDADVYGVTSGAGTQDEGETGGELAVRGQRLLTEG